MMGEQKVVLVTGGAGYVGSHACKALGAAGYTPVTYDNLSRGNRDAVKFGPLEVGDLADGEGLRRVFSEYRPLAVMHFAAFAYVAESMKYPTLYYENNVANTVGLLEAMREFGVDHIVFSSSCASYGIVESLPITEDTPQAPINPYGATKMMVEQILGDCGRAHGLKWLALRYFNAAGADPEGDIGENHDPEPHLVPRALMAAAGDVPFMEILGTDYDTKDGTAVRDFVHVSDIAKLHVTALEHLFSGGQSGTMNVGSTRGFSVREIVEAVERITDRPVPVRESPRRPGDPPALVADSSRAESVLGYMPRHSDLETIIETAWRWYRGRHNMDQ